MSKIQSKLFGLLQLAQLFDIVKPLPKGRKKRANVAGDKFYNGLSRKRVNGKWRVKK
jgi:hypothetical protein